MKFILLILSFILLVQCSSEKKQWEKPFYAAVKILTVSSFFYINGIDAQKAEYEKAASMQADLVKYASLACTKNESCSSFPLGRKQCGGPSSYLPYSSETSDAAGLKKKTDEYNQYIDYLMKKYEAGSASTCEYISSPELKCENSLCR